MTFDEAFSIVDKIGGFYEYDELQALWWTIHEIGKCESVLEVGVEKGRSASVICLAAKSTGQNPILYVVDAFCDHPKENIKDEFLANMMHIGQKVSFRECLSSEVGSPSWWPEDFDFVHIDGGHERETVLGDALAFGPRVRKGGRMAFHDYGRDSLPGVEEAVSEWWKREESLSWKWVTTAATTAIMEKIR